MDVLQPVIPRKDLTFAALVGSGTAWRASTFLGSTDIPYPEKNYNKEFH